MIQLPIRNQLYAMQLEGYQAGRYWKWWLAHWNQFEFDGVTPFRVTTKVWLLSLVYGSLMVLLLMLSWMWQSYWWWLVVLGAIIFPAPLLMLSLKIVDLMELPFRNGVKKKVGNSLRKYNITVVGITGSFGKSSTKEYLYEILNSYEYSLKTPQSYNTLYGIRRAVDYELNSHHRNFVCEMGAFGRGDIAELVDVVRPEYAILTGVGKQHLERFGSIEEVMKAKLELIEAVEPRKALVNIDQEMLKSQIRTLFPDVNTYSLKHKKADIYVPDYSLSSDGLEMTVVYKRETLSLKCGLFGTSSVQNLAGAVGTALLLKVPKRTIIDAVARLQPVPHRLELAKVGNATMIDNAYSSNQVGFLQLLDDVGQMKGKKVVVTPGLVELGEETRVIHEDLGEKMGHIADVCVLVGRSERTSSLEKGILKSEAKCQVRYVERVEMMQTIEDMGDEYDWILLENDLPGIY